MQLWASLCFWLNESKLSLSKSFPMQKATPSWVNCTHVGVKFCRIIFFNKYKYDVQLGVWTGDLSYSQGQEEDVWTNIRRVCVRVVSTEQTARNEREECVVEVTDGRLVGCLLRKITVNHWPLSERGCSSWHMRCKLYFLVWIGNMCMVQNSKWRKGK